jgi:hypothetical protein
MILVTTGSCIKEVDYNEGIVNNEKPTIRLPLAPEELVVYAFDAVPGDVDLDILEIRRDVISNSDLTQTVVAKINLDTALLGQYNRTHGSNYEVFTGYTLVSASETPFDGKNWTATFAPGEMVKYIKIRFDPSTMDFSKQNAIPFTITSADPYQISNHKSLITEVLAKNKYDGLYRATGNMVDAAVPTLTGWYPQDVYLVTTGAKTVKWVSADKDYLGYEFHLISNGGSKSAYGAYGPVFKFDDNDNVIEVTNFYGQPSSNGRSAKIDPSGVNKWDPSSKNLTVKYFLLQPGSTVRTTFDEVLQYLGPR